MAEYPFFPMFVDLSTKHVVVVGAGKIAARRVNTLMQFCPTVTVVAPEVQPDIDALAEAGRVILRKATYQPTDLAGADLVLACTDDAGLNAGIVEDCRNRGIMVNAASDRTLCDFLFPGIARRDNLVVGVTAGGEDHRLARRATEAIREQLERDI